MADSPAAIYMGVLEKIWGELSSDCSDADAQWNAWTTGRALSLCKSRRGQGWCACDAAAAI